MLIDARSNAQESSRFATKGTTELGGNISFLSSTPVYDGNTGTATTMFSLSPFIGYFVSDGFEIGMDPLGISLIGSSGQNTLTQITILAAPSYNFKTRGNGYPFIEGLFGYTSLSYGSSSNSGFSWGGRGGVKFAVTDKGLLNLAMQYMQIALTPSGVSNRSGSNQLSISAGFTIWL